MDNFFARPTRSSHLVALADNDDDSGEEEHEEKEPIGRYLTRWRFKRGEGDDVVENLEEDDVLDPEELDFLLGRGFLYYYP